MKQFDASLLQSNIRNLVVVSRLDGVGPTGVETHFRSIIRLAKVQKIEVTHINPYNNMDIWYFILNKIFKLLRSLRMFSTAYLVLSSLHELLLRKQLRIYARGATDRPIVYYAQDPLSAYCCSSVLRKNTDRLVMCVHFNYSETRELVEKGYTKTGSHLAKKLNTLEYEALNTADALIFVSEFMKRHIVGRFPGKIASKSCVVRNFPEFSIVPDASVSGQGLVAIGSLEPRKNQVLMLEIIFKLRGMGLDIPLTLVGDGPDREKLERRVQELGISDLVRFRGRVTNAQTLIPNFKALIHTALSENMPLVLIEALAHGRPVFAVPSGGVPEIVRDGVEGVHLNAANADECAARIAYFLNTMEPEASMYWPARWRYEQRFEMERAFSQICEILLK